MNYTRAITTAFLLLFSGASVHSQEVIKVRKSGVYHCGDPDVTVKEKDGLQMVKRKNYGGYSKVKIVYHYDRDLQQYYWIGGKHRIYYDKGWSPY